MKISEVNIQFIKPADGLIGFSSGVIDDAFYLGSIGVHQRLDGTGYRPTYPTKKSPLNNRPIFSSDQSGHPTKPLSRPFS
ncbi:MAG: hypothetical protein HYV02_00975 [Deltaproteobacteria bacterium]|nr:hypothetical protein [Deltaproteobacteria bacterium]